MALPKRVTARDVAALAGVSPGTVSKALSGKGAVHPDTRDRILAAARQLGLRATGLEAEGDRNLTVGLITWEPFSRRRTSPVLLGALEELAEHDVALLVCDGRGDPIREQHFVDSLLRRRVNGILVTGSSAGSFTRPPLRGDIDVPVVYMMSTSTDPDDTSVVPDNRGSAELAMRHLLATGRRRIGLILGPQTEDAAKLKHEAARSVLSQHGLELATEPLYGQWSEPWGRQATNQLLHNGAEIDGLLCGNDMIARGATSALESQGVAIPDEVGVIGCDDFRLMTEANRPQLSSVDLNLTEVGRLAGAKMIEAITAGRTTRGATTVECRLVPRESTAVGHHRPA